MDISYSHENTIDENIEKLEKVLFFMEEEGSLFKINKRDNMNTWKIQAKNGDGRNSHHSSVKNNK